MRFDFGKWYRRKAKPITPFQKFYGAGFGNGWTEREMCEDTWNACLAVVKERLMMYEEHAAAELLDILEEGQ